LELTFLIILWVMAVLVNGQACKHPLPVNATDFFFSGLHLAGNTSNPVGSRVTPVGVPQIPGLNTLGISIVRIDYAPWGINPPHTHPRATEILRVIEGSLKVGFVTSNQKTVFSLRCFRRVMCLCSQLAGVEPGKIFGVGWTY
jgi:hypothetical protein